jgi:FMN-dependent NADH-azoreductase
MLLINNKERSILMTTLLAILAHPHTEDFSWSLATFDAFISAYETAHPTDEVIIRDLFADKMPTLDNATFAAWKRNKYAPESLTEADKILLARHDEFISEFLAADKYVFVNPVYNAFIPAELKQYIDVIAVPRKLFRYTENGPVGLLQGKKSLHIQASGGFYHNETAPTPFSVDFGSQYIDHTMEGAGISEREQLFVEGYEQFPERKEEIKQTAFDKAQELGQKF